MIIIIIILIVILIELLCPAAWSKAYIITK